MKVIAEEHVPRQEWIALPRSSKLGILINDGNLRKITSSAFLKKL